MVVVPQGSFEPADPPDERDNAMGSMLSGLAVAVLDVAEGAGLSSDTVARDC
jgi:hypothetical protein